MEVSILIWLNRLKSCSPRIKQTAVAARITFQEIFTSKKPKVKSRTWGFDHSYWERTFLLNYL